MGKNDIPIVDINEMIKQAENFLNNIPNYKNNTINSMDEQFTKKIKEIGNSVIDRYYEEPEGYYKRKESLREIVNNGIFNNKYGNVKIDTNNPDLIPKVHRVDKTEYGNYFYEKMFVEGWHGGADMSEYGYGMSIPVGIPPEPYNGEPEPWNPRITHMKWIHPDAPEFSPKEEIDNKISDFYSGENINIIDEILKPYVKMVGKIFGD